MTTQEAKQILQLYRPGVDDAAEPEVAAALKLAKEDAELGHWLETQQAFHAAVSAKLREVTPPPGLKEKLLAQSDKIVALPQPPQRRMAWWFAAAAIVVGAVLMARMTHAPVHPDKFMNFQERMVSTAIRQYRMDITTNDMAQVRRYLENHGSPADYQVPAGLERLQLTGAASLRWRSNPVSMVCFDRGNKQMVFLFVTPRTALKDPPPAQPVEKKISQFETLSWSSGDKCYVLAGPPEADFSNKYL